MPPQTQRKLIARLAGFSGEIHSYDGGNERRLSNALDIPRGDGSNIVDVVDDPMLVYTDLTLKIIPERSRAFIEDMHALHLQHRDDPENGSTLSLLSLAPDGTFETVAVYTQCTIQDVQDPPGDTQAHSPAMATVIIRPRGRAAA